MQTVFHNANSAYAGMLRTVRDNGTELNIRGSKCIEITNYSYTITNPRDRIITERHRKFPLKAAMAEFLWYMTGNPLHSVITPYLKHWSNYSDDGTTVNSNYGFQWQNPKDQVKGVIEKLKKDKYSRQAVIDLYDKSYAFYYGKDNICTPSFQLFIRDGKLDMTVNSRSRDLIRGECIDQFTFTCLQELIANELKVELGVYKNNIGSLHVYEDHYELLNGTILYNDRVIPPDTKIWSSYSGFWDYISYLGSCFPVHSLDFIHRIVQHKEIDLGHFIKAKEQYADI